MRKRTLFISLLILVSATVFTTLMVIQAGPKVVSSQETYEKLNEVMDILENQYVEDIDQDLLIEGAIKGMVDSLEDPYTTYMDKEEAKGFHETISSSFEGIGAEVTEDNGKIIIVSPIKGSPAEKVGLKPEDQILEVDGESIEGLTVNEAVMKIRGEKGTKVELTIERAGVGEMTVTITRDTIPINTVYTDVTEDRIATIQITRFSENTGQELAEALIDLEQQNIQGIVLDLRQNPGGLMDQAIAMTDMFLEKGKTILKVEDKDGNIETYKASNPKVVNWPVVVLTDGGTASAAEIMAGALHESANIPIVGETTFGKGTVQNAQEFEDGTSIKYTIAKWLTPLGTWIHEDGLKPQYEVSLPDYAHISYLDPTIEISQGDSSNDVKTAEELFEAIGYEMEVDGFLDHDEVEVIEAFQQENELEKSGILTGKTTEVLLDLVREKIADNDTQLKKAFELLQK
ncbi:S41 family peptidase [Bacillus kexueae]|uniref:S41 family peptidase n=1 Tax=Aeribacillus kexueae TaxID=2078952 RepID=UPI001FAFCAC1